MQSFLSLIFLKAHIYKANDHLIKHYNILPHHQNPLLFKPLKLDFLIEIAQHQILIDTSLKNKLFHFFAFFQSQKFQKKIFFIYFTIKILLLL
jgi:hypothetical protein